VALGGLLAQATAALRIAGVPSPSADAELLAAHVLGVPRSRLPGIDVAPPEAARRLGDLVRRRCERVPLQHLTGSVGFRYLTLEVGSGVFVPRPETEVVAGFAIDALRRGQRRRDHGVTAPPEAHVRGSADGITSPIVVDLCTGSAAIALAVAHEVPGSRVYAVDVDDAALAWARRNAASTGLAVTLCHADVGIGGQGPSVRDVPPVETALADLFGRVDCVVANPPYLPDADRWALEPEVSRHDPARALWAGPDGLDGLRAVAGVARHLLCPGGLFVAEHADTHGSLAPGLLAASGGWTDIADHADLAGRPRFVTARRAQPATGRSNP
jgi:release factor glutamine methyltransferase